jgi:hypothetical protein
MVSILLLTFLGSQAQILRVNQLNNISLSASDSTIIDTLIRLHYYVNSNESPEVKAEIKNGPDIAFDSVYYSKDSSIRVFRYFWEDCGIYCFESDVVILVYADSIQNKLRFLQVDNHLRGKVNKIEKIEEEKFLIFSNSWSRAQGGGSNHHSFAALVSTTSEAEILWSFEIYSSDQDDEAIQYLDYDNKTKMISYCHKFYDYDKPQRDYIKTGTWLYTNGNFNINNEKTVYRQ